MSADKLRLYYAVREGRAAACYCGGEHHLAVSRSGEARHCHARCAHFAILVPYLLARCSLYLHLHYSILVWLADVIAPRAWHCVLLLVSKPWCAGKLLRLLALAYPCALAAWSGTRRNSFSFLAPSQAV